MWEAPDSEVGGPHRTLTAVFGPGDRVLVGVPRTSSEFSEVNSKSNAGASGGASGGGSDWFEDSLPFTLSEQYLSGHMMSASGSDVATVLVDAERRGGVGVGVEGHSDVIITAPLDCVRPFKRSGCGGSAAQQAYQVGEMLLVQDAGCAGVYAPAMLVGVKHYHEATPAETAPLGGTPSSGLPSTGTSRCKELTVQYRNTTTERLVVGACDPVRQKRCATPPLGAATSRGGERCCCAAVMALHSARPAQRTALLNSIGDWRKLHAFTLTTFSTLATVLLS